MLNGLSNRLSTGSNKFFRSVSNQLQGITTTIKYLQKSNFVTRTDCHPLTHLRNNNPRFIT